jgi:nitroreductase
VIDVATSEDSADDRLRHLLRERYREEQPAPIACNATLDVLLSHRSVRAYLPKPLHQGTLETLIAAAQSASSSSNLQAWSVIAVEDPDRRSRLAALARNQSHILQAPLFLVWLIDLNRLGRLAAARGEPSEGLDYLESFLMGAVDTSLAAQNAVVALESLGLGAVYIGAIRNRPAEVSAELGLPPHVFALFGLCVGWPDPAKPASVKPRLPNDAVLFRERYNDGQAQRNAIDRYNRHLRSFQQEEGLPAQDWSVQASDRIRDAKALHGRHVLRDVLHELGFPLK